MEEWSREGGWRPPLSSTNFRGLVLLIGLVFEPHSKSFTHGIQTKNEEELAGLKEWKESKGFREGESLWKMVVWRLGRGESDSLFFCLAPRDQLSTN